MAVEQVVAGDRPGARRVDQHEVGVGADLQRRPCRRGRSGRPAPLPSSSVSRRRRRSARVRAAARAGSGRRRSRPRWRRRRRRPSCDAGAGEWSVPTSVRSLAACAHSSARSAADAAAARTSPPRRAARRRPRRARGSAGRSRSVTSTPRRPRLGDQRDAAAGRDVDDVQRAAGLLRQQRSRARSPRARPRRAARRGSRAPSRRPAATARAASCAVSDVALGVDRDRQPERGGARHAASSSVEVVRGCEVVDAAGRT